MSKDWNKVYSEATTPGEPAEVLVDNLHLLPSSGSALDLACGLGANSLLLASLGLNVDCWDSSPMAIVKLQQFAAQQGVVVKAVVGDVHDPRLSSRRWDVIVVTHFLDRLLCSHLPDMLSPGGLLFYQTFTLSGATDHTPRNTSYLLEENELLELFGCLRILYFREEGQAGNLMQGSGSKSFLVAQQPGS